MRITNTMRAHANLLSIERRGERYGEAQRQLTTGKRVEAASDDPAASARVLKLRSSLARNLQFQRNLDTARMRLGHAELSLQRVTDQLDEARAFAVQASTGTWDGQDRTVLAQEIDQILEGLAGEANRRFLGNSLYAGSQVDQQPFTVLRDAQGRISQVGAPLDSQDGRVVVKLSETEELQVSVLGRDVFMGGQEGGEADVFATLVELRDSLLANDPVATGESLGRIDATISAVNGTRAALGTRMQRVDVVESQLFSRQELLTDNISEEEDADLAEAMMRVNLEQVGYQAALKAISDSMSTSLLNFLT
jgi:flagellar hook-associated protein 3 FlgL